MSNRTDQMGQVSFLFSASLLNVQDLRKSHADCWGSQLFDHVLREHAVLDLIDGFSALVGQVLES